MSARDFSRHEANIRHANNQGQRDAEKESGAEGGSGSKPVLIDLDGDGLEVTALDRSTVFLDTGGDGFLHRTAWAGEGDGVLYFDPDGRNEITEKRQFVFTEWDPTATSDLEALASVFDSNGDGILSTGDTDFAKFKVMVTLADGSTVSKTLAELGITEIDLTADATNIELADGSVITGKTTFTRADGTTGTVGDMLLAAEAEGHRVEQAESVDGVGSRSLTTTAYAADGSKAYEIFSEVSADGLSVTNRYDDNGDGVIDRIQTIETMVGADGSRTELEQNFAGADEASAVLTSQTETQKLVNPATGVIDEESTEIISRDSMGGGWFDQRETRSFANGSLTVLVENLAKDGTVITSGSETVSADGTTRIDGVDADGDGAADTTETHIVDKHADDSRTETVTVTNQDGSLRSRTIEEVGADNRSKVITRDLNGDGQIDQREILNITVSPSGGSTSRLDIRNGDGSLKSSSTTVTSDDALTKTTALDRDGDGDVDLTTVDATTVNADGSRERIVTETNGDGSIRAMRKEILDADKVGQEIWVDLNQNGSFEAGELVSSVVVDASTSERIATSWTRSADSSVLAKVTAKTSADGLTTETESDLDGDGDIDLRVSDVTVLNGDGTSSRTVTTKNQDSSLRTIVETETSADGLSKTVREDVDGDSQFEKITVNTLEREADGGTTQTASAYAGNGTTLLSRTITTESADRRTQTITLDRDGDGATESTSVRVKGTDGAVTQTVTETATDGTVLGETTTTLSANGLTTTTATDFDGDQVADVTSHSSTTLNADGSRTTVQTTENGDGSLRSSSVVTVSDDGLKTVTKTDADGNGTFERTTIDETVLETDGGTTRLLETRSQSGQLLGRSRTETSDDGLVTVQRTDRDGDGSYDLVETTTTELEANGSTLTTAEIYEGGVLRSSVTRNVSSNGRTDVTESDVNGDGKTDLLTTRTIAHNGVVVTVTQNLDTSGTVQNQIRTVQTGNGLATTDHRDADGDGVFETRKEVLRELNADGSVTTTTSSRSQNGALHGRTEETVSDDGLKTTRIQDFDGDGLSDETSVREAVIAANGTITTTQTVSARNGATLQKSVETVTGDGRSTTLAVDADGNGQNDTVTTTVVGNDGGVTTTASAYSKSGALIARTVTKESGNGLEKTASFDLDGNGAAERTLNDKTVIAADGTTTRTMTHEAGSGRLLAREEVTRSDDGLTVTTALDLDGQAGNDFVTTKTTSFGHDGATTEHWSTFGPGGQKSSTTRTTSGDGLEVTTATDLDGDGDIDRSTSLEVNATGGSTEITRFFGNGTDLQRSETTLVSADGRQSSAHVDLDGNGKTDIKTQTTIDLSGNETTTWTDYAANGSTVEAVITREASANGTSDIYRLDTDGDGSTDVTRKTTISYDNSGNETRVFEETEAVGGLAFKSTTVTSANGLTSTRATDSDGDGEIDTRMETKTVFNADGSSTTTSRDWYEDSGDLRSSYTETVSADGRTVIESFDFDGDNVTDKSRVTKTAADGSVVVTETGFGENGAQKRAVTETSSDGLTTTVLRDGVTQTFSRSELGNGSYDWDNGKTGTDRVTVSHKVDATGVEAWEMTSAAGIQSARFDAAAKALLLAEAARLYDAALDRDMDASEIEVLVQHALNGQLDLEGLAAELLGSAEYSTRYGTLTDTGFVARAYQNTFGREPDVKELGEHLAALNAGTSRAALIAELSESAEHIVVGNGHGETNNHDVFLIDVVKEEELTTTFGIDGLALSFTEDNAAVGTNAGQTIGIGSNAALLGLGGNDTLYGSTRDDILVGGTGNDTLRGGDGDDTFIYQRGDGHDAIIDSVSGTRGNTLIFGEGIEVEDLHFTHIGGDEVKLEFHAESASEAADAAANGLAPLTGSITLHNWLTSGSRPVEWIFFQDGSSLWFGGIANFGSGSVDYNLYYRLGDGNDNFASNGREPDGNTGGQGSSDIIVGAGGNDTIYGKAGHDHLIGGAGDDRLYGADGNDFLDAGEGTGSTWQYLYGQQGNDTYFFEEESGKVYIDHTETSNTGTDTVRFKDLTLEDFTFSTYDFTHGGTVQTLAGTGLNFNLANGQTGTLRIANMGTYIERFEFADGTVLDKIEVRTDGRYHIHGASIGESGTVVTGTSKDDYVFGTSKADVLDAGGTTGGWQHLFGYGGDDLFLYGKRSGNVLVNYHDGAGDGTDTIRFKDLTLADVTIGTYQYTSGSNGLALSFKWNDGVDSGELRVANEGQYIERYEFADGSALSKVQVLGDGRYKIHGAANSDGGRIIHGTTRDDYVYGGSGADILDAGVGAGNWQHLFGYGGNDLFLYGKEGGNVLVNYHEGEGDGTADTVRFKDLTLADLTVGTYQYTSGSNGLALSFKWNDSVDSGELRVANLGQYIERYEFADGSALSKIIVRDDGRYQIYGAANSDGGRIVIGTSKDDYVYGGDGADILDAGAGAGNWQHLFGHGGNDLFLYGKEGGNVLVNYHEGEGDGNADTVRFKDLALADLTVGTYQYTSGSNGLALSFKWSDGVDSGELRVANLGQYIERFEFADGNVLSAPVLRDDGRLELRAAIGATEARILGSDLDDLVYGTNGDDVLSAGKGLGGFQHISGYSGDDTYYYSRGGGNVMINASEREGTGNDTLILTDLALSDVTFGYLQYAEGNPNGRALQIFYSDAGGNGELRIANEGQHIERFEFADGNVLSAPVLRDDGRLELRAAIGATEARILGSDLDDLVYGTNGDDVLSAGKGLGGFQHISGYSGDDTYYYSRGGGNVMINASEREGTGNDTLILTDLALSDVTFGYLQYAEGNPNGRALQIFYSDADGNGELRIANEGQHIERFEFADGTSLSSLDVQADGLVELLGSSGNDRIAGTAVVDHLTGGAGSDTFVFTDGHGNDTVTDFTGGEDMIQIEGGGVSFADLVLEASGSDALVRFGTSVITLEGVQVSTLDQDDFLFV